MITCVIRYVIDPYQLDNFEAYASKWIKLVNKLGGNHHGYLLPSEGKNNEALALFSFPSLAEYEKYRAASFCDEDCIQAFKFAEDTRCILGYERSFMRPLGLQDL